MVINIAEEKISNQSTKNAPPEQSTILDEKNSKH
jgi:hypothetical protein